MDRDGVLTGILTFNCGQKAPLSSELKNQLYKVFTGDSSEKLLKEFSNSVNIGQSADLPDNDNDLSVNEHSLLTDNDVLIDSNTNINYNYNDSISSSYENIVVPEILAIGLQEACSIMDGLFGEFSNVLSSIEHGISQCLLELNKNFPELPEYYYKLEAHSHIGPTVLLIFTLRSQSVNQVVKISNIKFAEAGVTGPLGVGIKGATGIRFTFHKRPNSISPVWKSTDFTFVSAHLSANEGRVERRNFDYIRIAQELVFTQEPSLLSSASVETELTDQNTNSNYIHSSTDSNPNQTNEIMYTSSPHHLFFFGDLNYRAGIIPTDTESQTPSHSENSNDLNLQYLNTPNLSPLSYLEFSSKLLYESLLHDELTKERKAGNTLFFLSEPKINFPPTYKFKSTDTALAEEVAFSEHNPFRTAPISAQNAILNNKKEKRIVSSPQCRPFKRKYETKRVPSWTDRVLYLDQPQYPTEVLQYTCLPFVTTSDHMPVYFSAISPWLDSNSQNIYKNIFEELQTDESENNRLPTEDNSGDDGPSSISLIPIRNTETNSSAWSAFSSWTSPRHATPSLRGRNNFRRRVARWGDYFTAWGLYFITTKKGIFWDIGIVFLAMLVIGFFWFFDFFFVFRQLTSILIVPS